MNILNSVFFSVYWMNAGLVTAGKERRKAIDFMTCILWSANLCLLNIPYLLRYAIDIEYVLLYSLVSFFAVYYWVKKRYAVQKVNKLLPAYKYLGSPQHYFKRVLYVALSVLLSTGLAASVGILLYLKKA